MSDEVRLVPLTGEQVSQLRKAATRNSRLRSIVTAYEDGLTLREVEALHFHYTKNGIPKAQTAATELAAKLSAFTQEPTDE